MALHEDNKLPVILEKAYCLHDEEPHIRMIAQYVAGALLHDWQSWFVEGSIGSFDSISRCVGKAIYGPMLLLLLLLLVMLRMLERWLLRLLLLLQAAVDDDDFVAC